MTVERNEVTMDRRTIDALCGNDDFRNWLYCTLRDLCAYELDEGKLTEFGQGIRASASRIKNTLLASPAAVEMLAEFERTALSEKHEAIVKTEMKTKENEDGRTERDAI